MKKLINWIIYFFSDSNIPFEKFSKLQEQELILNKEESIYKNGEILQNFAFKLYNFGQFCHPIKKILLKTTLSENPHIYYNSWGILVQQYMKEENCDFLYYHLLQDKIINSSNPLEELENINANFNSFLSKLEKIPKEALNDNLDRFSSFQDLIAFDFINMLKKFNNRIQSFNQKNIAFSNIKGTYLLDDLEDLYYILSFIEYDYPIRNALVNLIEKTDKDLKAETLDLIDTILQNIEEFLNKEFTIDQIKNLLQVIKKDPNYIPYNRKSSPPNYLMQYHNYLTYNFKKNQGKLYRTIQKNDNYKQINNFFEEKKLYFMKGYNAKTNQYLQEKTLNNLEYIFISSIFKSFFIYKWEHHHNIILEFLQSIKLIDESILFSIKEFLIDVSTIKNKITMLEESLNNVDNKFNFTLLTDSIDLDPMVANSIIAGINQKVLYFLQENYKKIYFLTYHLSEILSDIQHKNNLLVKEVDYSLLPKILQIYKEEATFLKMSQKFIQFK